MSAATVHSTEWLLNIEYIPSPPSPTALQRRVRNEMHASKHNCHHWHPVWKKMSIFILWAEFISCVCYTQFQCVSFLSQWQMRWKIHVKNTLAESSHTAILHSGVRTERNSMKRHYIKKQEVQVVTEWWHFMQSIIMIMNMRSLSPAPCG